MNSKLEKVIKFSGWTPSPNTVTIGMERDNKVFSLKFDGLPDYPNGTAYLHIDCGENGADSIEVVDGTAEIKRNVTQYEGEKEAYVEILADGDVVWHSDVIMVTVKRLPILGEKIEQEYPTAFEQALAQTAADKAAAAKSAAAAAAAAAGIVTEEAERKDAESERVKAEAARKTAEGKREKAEAAREQKTDAAVKRADDLVKSVEDKLENGDFVGAQGPQGPIGETGPQGVPGTQGEKGEKGDKGDTGATGPQGVPGTNGADGAPGKDGRDGIDAPQIDDTTVSDAAPWSSQHIVDTLCPPLEESGNPVVCYPVAGSKLGVTASWEPTQEGEGTPYPAGGGPNLLDISQCTATVDKPYGVTITIDGDVFKISGVPSSEVTEERQYSFGVAFCTQTELRGKGYKVTAFAIKGKISNAWGLRTESEGSLAISTILTPGVDTDIQFRLMVSKDTPAAYAPYANIRPIRGRNNVSITRQEDDLSMALTLLSTIYGGEVDAVTGAGKETWKLLTLTGEEQWKYESDAFFVGHNIVNNPPIESYGKCSHFIYQYNFGGDCIFCTGDSVYTGTQLTAKYTNVNEWKAYLAAQYAAGTPVQVAYKLATPIHLTATGGGAIKALSSVNTILTDADTLTVTGHADPIHIIQQLQAASAASAQALADVERAVTDI